MSRNAFLAFVLLSFGLVHAQTRPFSVKDDIEMERFNDPPPASGEGQATFARTSPDGKWVAVTTTRGLLSQNRVRSTISLFNVNQAKAYLATTPSGTPPTRKVIAQIESYPHHSEPDGYAPVIKDVRWSPDSGFLYFTAEDLQGIHHLYRVRTDGTGLHSLTPATRDVRRYELGANMIVYKATELPNPGTGNSHDAIAEAVDGRSIPEILFPHEDSSFVAKTWKLWSIRFDGDRERTSAVRNYLVRTLESMSASSTWDPIAISPKGDQVAVLTQIGAIPRSWSAYNPSVGHDDMRYQTDDPALLNDNNQMRPREYALIDLRTGLVTPLLRAPEGLTLGYVDHNQIVWSSNGRRVLLTNTFMPLASDAATAQPVEPCVVASVDLPSLQNTCLIFNTQRAKNFTGDIFTGGVRVAFGATENDIVVTYNHDKQGPRPRLFHYERGGWVETPSDHAPLAPPGEAGPTINAQVASNRLQFEVKQDLNDPPKLWASDEAVGASKVLWDPNPQLSQIEFGEASVLKWRDRTGREWTAGLIKPVDYDPLKKYPLVIQLYEFDPHTFLTDGSWPTAFSARHLASAGFVVLQIQKDMVFHGPTDAQEHLEAYRSAIDLLSQKGLINRSKVGVVGFSTTSWYVENAIIACPKLFAAATIADGLDYSYMQYHLVSERSTIQQRRDESMIGAKPVGEGLKTWFDASPGFNLDKVLTPLRIEAMKPFSLLGEWEIYSSLKMQHKPVDLIYFPSSQHIHQQPQARLESQQGNVDWMRFWLQGYEDPAPEKANEYRRWEKLRATSEPETQQRR